MSDNPNTKGNIAELEIALAAERAGLLAYKPIGEHGRTDMVLEIGETLYRVQCKWGRMLPERNAVAVNLTSSRWTPNGEIKTRYQQGEVDLVGVYCAPVDRCYLLPERLFVDKRSVQLRLTPARNGQRSCINLAEDYEFNGAVAQLARALRWQRRGQGFESPQLHSNPPMSIGSDEFRNRLGYYLDLAAEGQELTITRWGKRFLRVTLWQPQLPEAQAA